MKMTDEQYVNYLVIKENVIGFGKFLGFLTFMGVFSVLIFAMLFGKLGSLTHNIYNSLNGLF